MGDRSVVAIDRLDLAVRDSEFLHHRTVGMWQDHSRSHNRRAGDTDEWHHLDEAACCGQTLRPWSSRPTRSSVDDGRDNVGYGLKGACRSLTVTPRFSLSSE